MIFVPIPWSITGRTFPWAWTHHAAQCAYAVCESIGKGVVMRPRVHYIGTERELPALTLESLGFGKDFPSALWQSHYQQEQVFAMILADTLEMLVGQRCKAIIIVNGHGARNQRETIDRLAKQFTRYRSDLPSSLKSAILIRLRSVAPRRLAPQA